MRDVLTEDDAARIFEECGIDLLDMTPVPFTTFDPATGRVLQTGTHGYGVALYLSQVEGNHIIGKPPENAYVDTAAKAFKLREPCPAIMDGHVLRGLPRPCTIEIFDGAGGFQGYSCDEDTAEIVFSYSDVYTVVVLSVPYLDGVFKVEVA